MGCIHNLFLIERLKGKFYVFRIRPCDNGSRDKLLTHVLAVTGKFSQDPCFVLLPNEVNLSNKQDIYYIVESNNGLSVISFEGYDEAKLAIYKICSSKRPVIFDDLL